jgi:hypothetical protein
MAFDNAGTNAVDEHVQQAQREIFREIFKLDSQFQPRSCDLGTLTFKDKGSLWRPDLEAWEIKITLTPDATLGSHHRLPITRIETFLRPLGNSNRVKNVAELPVGNDIEDSYCIEIRALLAHRVRSYERKSVAKAVIFLTFALADKLTDLTPEELAFLTEDVCEKTAREYGSFVDTGTINDPLETESSST